MRTVSARAAHPTHPSPGDVCVGCRHRPDPQSAHFYWVDGGLEFTRPDKHVGTAVWILLCDACVVEHGPDITASIDKGRVKIACDLVWPEGLNVTFLTH